MFFPKCFERLALKNSDGFLGNVRVRSWKPVSKAVNIKQSFPITMKCRQCGIYFIRASSLIHTAILKYHCEQNFYCCMCKMQSIATFAAVIEVMDYRYSMRVHLALWFSKVIKRERFRFFCLFYNNVFIRKVIYIHCWKWKMPENIRKTMKIANNPTMKK